MRAALLDPDDVAGLGAVPVGDADVEIAPQLTIGRRHEAQAIAAGRLVIETEDLLGAVAEAADDPGLIGVLAAPLQRGEYAVADGGRSGAA